ncbi:MAG: HEAT repeat domain-containing protein [Limisphaerales bacterium]
MRGGAVYWAARALGEIGPAASAAVPSLARMTNEAAAVALIEINQGSFQLFFERLKDTSAVGKWCGTAEEVGHLGANADPAIPLLLAGFQHTNDRILSLAARTVGKLHRRPDLCLGPLVSLLNSTNSHLRRHVLVALGAFGPAAKPVAPEIALWLNDRDPWVRTEATNALRLIDLEGPGVKGKRL